jgi:hypothetical protein
MNELITVPLTASVAKNTINIRKTPYSKIINVVDCKTCKKKLLAVEYLILIIYNYPTVKTRILYKSTDGSAGQTAHNPPNSDRMGNLHQTLSELMVGVY